MFDTQTRKVIYIVMAVLGLVVGALQSGYAGVDPRPDWLDVVTNVWAYLTGATGILATINTPAPPQEIAEEATKVADDMAETQ